MILFSHYNLTYKINVSNKFQIRQIIDAKEIENEIELLKYQLSSSYEDSFEGNNDQAGILDQWIDENDSVMPQRNLRTIKMYY